MALTEEQDTSWIVELETSLLDGCDFGTLRNICRSRPVAPHLRPEVWQICLNIGGKSDALTAFDELYDMPEQAVLREDCHALVDKLGNEEEDKVSVVSDLESIITFYCKSRGVAYEHSNGWLDLLQVMLALRFSRADLYNSFYAIVTRYIPRETECSGAVYHLFRLLLLYHDPELCSFLDSRKITPDLYTKTWFNSLFASVCDLEVILNMWDVYLLHADPFLMCFLALVILVNARDQLFTMQDSSKEELLATLCLFPSALEAEDIEDFCSLAQYYASKTPQSFRRDYQMPLFGSSLVAHKPEHVERVAQALCLPVSVSELLQANQLSAGEGVRYFIVDCRPAEQYNSGHLSTAFHLDANLMLQNPGEFSTAVQALFATQKQAIAAGSIAGGEHLCFMGSGREEEDQYVHMVVAHFLQKNHQYISVTRGGYAALHEALKDCLAEGLTDHSYKSCISCNPNGAGSDLDSQEGDHNKEDSILGKLSFAMKTKSAIVKEKLTNYIKNEQIGGEERHVSSQDKVGKRYRNMASVFSIADEEEDDTVDVPSSDEERRDIVNIETWINKSDVKHAYDCQQVKDNGYMCPSHILITEGHLYILRIIPSRKGMAWIQARRSLGSIVKITSKKKHPELITFKYGTNEEDGLHITAVDRFLIQRASEATKVIKTQIMKVLDAMET